MRPPLEHLDLFSGIGGFALAAMACGVRTIAFSEIDPWCCGVLIERFPGVPNLGDIQSVTGERVGRRPWLLTGGFPCQPYSLAGKRRGSGDDRALWPEMRRVIEESQPHWILAENVPGIIGMELDRVLADLEAIGYATGTLVVPACAVDARHRRNRIWIVAHAPQQSQRESPDQTDPQPNGRATWHEPLNSSETLAHALRTGLAQRQIESAWEECSSIERGSNAVPDTNSAGSAPSWSDRRVGRFRQSVQTGPERDDCCHWLPEPGMGRVASGIPHRMDRLKALGNAIVPQVAAQIIRAMILAP